jgi:hypothetical protein
MSTSDQVAAHVAAARNLAACLEAVGVGTHPTRGHAAILRRIANHIEGTAAKNEKPSEFNEAGLYASAAGGAEVSIAAAIGRDPALGRLLDSIDLAAAGRRGETISVDDLDEKLGKAGITGRHAIEAKMKLRAAGVLR